MWKVCTKCKKHKALWEFCEQKGRKFSVSSQCRECRNQHHKDRWVNDTVFRVDRLTSQKDKWHNDPVYREAHSTMNKHYKKNNPDKVSAWSAKRRATKLNQTPELTEAQKQEIVLIYRKAQELGSAWHVDHIIPLSKGGLHCPDNMQIIPAEHNLRKNNSLDYIVPENLIIKINK